MVQVIWLPETIVALNAIRDYIGRSNPAAADTLTDKLKSAGESLAYFPNRGRPAGRYRELATVPPYVIRYRVAKDVVYIVRIKHGRQRR